ncbi:hypothetical protein B0H13DRAFT_1882595 [Mycena leptocephala]|nr:hypothetical protein B0H13DRAFT_1882595 [Mycena leptocephala]
MVPGPFTQNPEEFIRTFEIFARVCSAFRATVLANPAFWSRLYLDEKTNPMLLAACLYRSRSVPLTIFLSMIPPQGEGLPPAFWHPTDPDVAIVAAHHAHWNNIFDLLRPIMRRARRLTLRTYSAPHTPFLVNRLHSIDCSAVTGLHLELYCDDDSDFKIDGSLFRPSFPALEYLAMAETWLVGLAPACWSLTVLRLSGNSMLFLGSTQGLWDLLCSTASCLVALELTNVTLDAHVDTFPYTTLVMPCVTELALSFVDSSTIELLGHSHFPALNLLDLMLTDSGDCSYFIDKCGSILHSVTTCNCEFLQSILFNAEIDEPILRHMLSSAGLRRFGSKQLRIISLLQTNNPGYFPAIIPHESYLYGGQWVSNPYDMDLYANHYIQSWY